MPPIKRKITAKKTEEKPKKAAPVTKEPTPARKTRKDAQDGHWRQRLADPVTVEKLNAGMSVVIAGELVRVLEVSKVRKVPGSYLVKVKGSTLVLKAEDLLYRTIAESFQE